MTPRGVNSAPSQDVVDQEAMDAAVPISNGCINTTRTRPLSRESPGNRIEVHPQMGGDHAFHERGQMLGFW